jgi:methionine biosynthesis protein MetW
MQRNVPQGPGAHRVDHLLIAEMVEPGSRVLDVGCGDGALLQLLAETKSTDGRGVELSRERVNACVTRGLSVIQGDADRDLGDYPDQAFDYAILSLTIQATRYPKTVLENLLRIGRRAIVSFPNFGHWRIRTELLLTGRMPQTPNLPEPWYASPDAPSRILPISSPSSTPRSRALSPSTLPGNGCPSTARFRYRTCLARRRSSCCASAPSAEGPAPAILRGFAIPPMFPALS